MKVGRKQNRIHMVRDSLFQEKEEKVRLNFKLHAFEVPNTVFKSENSFFLRYSILLHYVNTFLKALPGHGEWPLQPLNFGSLDGRIAVNSRPDSLTWYYPISTCTHTINRGAASHLVFWKIAFHCKSS